MKTLAVRDGDLVLGPGGHQTITGVAKLKQDLSLAMIEALGSDPYHPGWGSTLQQFVGEPTDLVIGMVRGEVERILSNYVGIQRAIIQADTAKGRKPRFGAGEIIRSVDDIRVTQSMDRITVRIFLTVLDGTAVEIEQQIGAL